MMKPYAAKDCTGTMSIQQEINNIAKSLGDEWPKLITDTKWREEIRQQLRKSTTEWCDYRAKTCVCP